MIVTFISQCEKKALPKTRRVLDAFANRIGQRTWQTAITQHGLNAVKQLLRKTASKNTAVSCHQLRSRARSELVWIVGKRSKFNAGGYVPVNVTQKNILHFEWENDWHHLPLVKSLSALAALFHDWGKASALFQEKLNPNNKKTFKGDPLRHEWISTVLLRAYVGTDSDEQWLTRLIQGECDTEQLKTKAKEFEKDSSKEDDLPKLLHQLPPAATVLAWLVLSHHRLPVKGQNTGTAINKWDKLFKKIRQNWGYQHRYKHNEAEFQAALPNCFRYLKGLPSDSATWRKAVKKQASRLLNQLPALDATMKDGTIRIILNQARLSLMLGDHYYSSLPSDDPARLPPRERELALYANTDKTGQLKQTLDEHLVGVAKQAQKTAHFLPLFEGKQNELAYSQDVNALRKKSPPEFKWQDKAVEAIQRWRDTQEKQDSHHFGFFAVNMASTGKGKTFANAKIMRALSFDRQRLRYVLALGLRTLTLQTGREYRERIGLQSDELAVLIGSQAILNLFQQQTENQTTSKTTEAEAEKKAEAEASKVEADAFLNGSESEEELLDSTFDPDFDTVFAIPNDDLKTVLRTNKERQFLYAPVLTCTIDHLMAATETQRGGRYILPTLRLMSSDLVIDEIDDFDGKDLIAIGRLIHLAGMSGRKVMISSATIPPDLAEGYFNAYQAGWMLFATLRKLSPVVGCAWFDENPHKTASQVHTIDCQQTETAIQHYQQHHQQFVKKRLAFLQQQPIKRKADMADCPAPETDDESQRQTHYFEIIQKAIQKQHRTHCQTDHQSGKSVSFGVVRMANITPCVELTQYLLDTSWDDNTAVRIMVYHSRQVLLMRHEQEKHLDAVLKRDKSNDQAIYTNKIIRKHLDQIHQPHVIFIAVVSPVEEVGRDHDWDWAIIEPSSYRSIIQMAGRVLRHRELSPAAPNITLMQKNLKGFLGKKLAFCLPGYETRDLPLMVHDLEQLVDMQALQNTVDATPRIHRNTVLAANRNLADLEHESIHQLLTCYNAKGPESLQGWLDLQSYWWLTAVPQYCTPFRASQPELNMYLVPTEDGLQFFEKDKQRRLAATSSDNYRGITHQNDLSDIAKERLWLPRDYGALLQAIDEEANIMYLAAIYGEISVPIHPEKHSNAAFIYSNQLGLIRKK